ncbi:MAG: hypothetical protein KGL39_58880, partial [Patescibacteria group bacterium]|nr:hypothetical protein [Patescibacteria group bacterium]
QDGNPFEPYADSTAKTRARKGLQTDFVDLTFAGLMMDGIQFADNYLYVGGEHGYIADFHMLGGDHLPSRQFFKAGETVGPLIERAIAGAIVRL